MNWEPLPSPALAIRDVRTTIRGSELHLSWFWPKEVDYVYLYKAPVDQLKQLHDLEERDLLFYTKEEYKANQGYKGRLEAMGRSAYRIIPCQKRDGRLILLYQDNDDNLTYITGSKAKIYFSISYKQIWLKPKKLMKMSIMTEFPIDRDLLVYVKKRGSAPSSLEDGTVYPFNRNFPSGTTELFEKELDKDEYIRIFFRNGKHSAQHYELIPQ
ncbi:MULTISPECIES: beta-mannanase [Bacillaceae]|uniref:beta-mannanase n=1 Tax=Bacillaceae TaxID=186817 RepID=UPI002FFEA0FB